MPTTVPWPEPSTSSAVCSSIAISRGVVFLNGWSATPRDIAIAEQTALLVDGSGHGTVVGISTVYFMQAPGAPELCQSKTPLTYHNIAIYRINVSGTFSLSKWTGTNGTAYTVTANAGVLSSTQSGGAIY